MNQDKQPEALRLSAWLQDGAFHRMTLGDAISAGRELRRQHARIAELEAELAAVKEAPAAPAAELQRMTAGRACYFMERFLKEEKLLGPNEQAALHFVINMLAAPAEQAADTVRHVVLKEGIPVCAVTESGAIVGTSGGVTWTAGQIDPIAASAKGGA